MSYTYQAGLTGGTDARDDLFQKIRAAMLAQGWTQLDVISDTPASRNIVFKGVELTPGKGNGPIVRVFTIITTPTRISYYGYADWDPITHTGSKESGSASQTYLLTQEAQHAYFLRVNPVAVAVCSKIGSGYNKCSWGFFRRHLPAHKAGVVLTAGASAAGVSTVNVTTDPRAGLQVGQRVLLQNFGHASASANFSNAELREIASMAAGSITFTAPLVKAYDAGALIGLRPYPMLIVGQSIGDAGGPTYVPHDDTGATMGITSHFQLTAVVPGISVSGVVGTTTPHEFFLGHFAISNNAAGKQMPFVGTLYHWQTIHSYNSIHTLEDTFDDGNGGSLIMLHQSQYTVTALGPR